MGGFNRSIHRWSVAFGGQACTYSHDPRAPIELENAFIRPVSKARGRVGCKRRVLGQLA